LTSTGRRTERRTRPVPHATVSRACVQCLRLCCVGRRRSPPRLPTEHPLSSARSIPAEEAADTDHEPTEVSIPAMHREAHHLPENRDAFRRHDTRRNSYAKRSLSPAFVPALSSTPPTLFPQEGRVLCWALQMSRCGHPRSVTVPPAGGSRVQTLFLLPWSRLGLTTQACQGARPTWPSTGADCPARTNAGRSA
jgi:hypothetical protein